MTLNQFPAVDLDEQEKYTLKFVVAKLSDSSGATKTVVVGKNFSWKHDTIFGNLEARLLDSGITVKRLGGGIISRWEKRIGIHSSSMDCGKEPDRKETVCLVRAAYPDFEVKQVSSFEDVHALCGPDRWERYPG